MNEISIYEVRRRISTFIESAALDARIIDTLRCEEKLLPKECELWDYKKQANDDALGLGQTVLEIVGFYNAYGGYLIYGVEETKDNLEFTPIGISPQSVKVHQMKQMVKNYTGEDIDLTYIELPYKFGDSDLLIGLLHIPKRIPLHPPVIFGKNGPEDKPGHVIFKKGAIYLRNLDSCVPAESRYDLQFLCGKRENTFLVTFDQAITKKVDLIVEHNLPERNFICPQFFGRDEIMAKLWRWLADDLDRTKVLAGDGGKGKTSIAYEFASDVCHSRPCGIEKIVWLTAKTKQFKGGLDKFVPMPRTDFSDTETMLKSLCSELAILDKETEGATVPHLKKLLRNALTNISCLVVIDDVDSTESDAQRMILETAMQFTNTGGRFLLTTRMNITYSQASCITVEGFPEKDYGDYIAHLIGEFHLSPLTKKQEHSLWIVTDGSPLYTESLLRLCRFMPLDKAMREWKGKLGSEVRKAALRREIEGLPIESKRVLLACALMSEGSVTELKKATGYDDERMMLCLEELKSLFLLSAKPFIKQEPRFAVSNNTARLVLENKDLLVTDPTALEHAVSRLRGRHISKGMLEVRRTVGAAIAQANALIRDNRCNDALETIDVALEEAKNDPNLLLMRGRCFFMLYSSTKQNTYLTDARKTFSKAYEYGQHQETLYTLWYASEMAANHPQGAIEVCSIALRDSTLPVSFWLKQRADAYNEASLAARQSYNIQAAITSMRNCLNDLGTALHHSVSFEKQATTELFFQAADDLWEMMSSAANDVPDIRDLFLTVRNCINLGDIRIVEFDRLVRTSERLQKCILRYPRITKAQSNLLRQTIREAKEQLDKYVPKSYELTIYSNIVDKCKNLDSSTSYMDN